MMKEPSIIHQTADDTSRSADECSSVFVCELEALLQKSREAVGWLYELIEKDIGNFRVLSFSRSIYGHYCKSSSERECPVQSFNQSRYKPDFLDNSIDYMNSREFRLVLIV